MANSKDVVVTGVSTGIGWGTTRTKCSANDLEPQEGWNRKS